MNDAERKALEAIRDAKVMGSRNAADLLKEADEQDPNADLIDYTFMIDDKEWKVTKTPVWSDGTYVEIQHDESKTVRPAGLVRKHKLADWLVT